MPRLLLALALAILVGEQPATIPFELINRHITLPVSVNGSKPLTFLLDTGDKYALVDLDRARELSLTFGQSVDVGGVGTERLAGSFLNGATFQVAGNRDLSGPVVLAIPLKRLAARLGHEFDGILGADFIKTFVVEIDYESRTLRLHAPETFAYEGKGESIPIRLNAIGHPLIEAEVTPIGGTPLKGSFVLDIGSGAALALMSPFVAEHHLPGSDVKTIPAMGVSGAGGEAGGRFGRVASLRIGRVTLSKPVTLFSEDKTGAFANPALAGNIGYDVLRRFRIFLDYSHNRVILEPTSLVETPFDRPSTGMVIEADTADFHSFKVTGVLDPSPASEAGVHTGDVVTAVDDRPAADLTLTSMMELFEKPVPRKVTIRRGTEALTVTLTPRVLV
jgi:Aspartyl protease